MIPLGKLEGGRIELRHVQAMIQNECCLHSQTGMEELQVIGGIQTHQSNIVPIEVFGKLVDLYLKDRPLKLWLVGV